MKLKRIFRSLKKIPLLCLLVVTIFLSDGIYDGILPWPSPFHIPWSYLDRIAPMNRTNKTDRTGDGRPGMSVPENADENPAIPLANTDAPNDGDAVDVFAAGGDAEHAPANIDGTENSPVGADGPDGGINDIGTDATENIPVGSDSDSGEPLSESDGLQQADHTAVHNDSDPDTENNDPDMQEPEQTALGEDGLPLVQYMQVEDDYFDDAVFIGDSRTRSLQLYANLEHTTFLADTGLTIYTVLDKKLTPSTMTSKTTVTDYLANHQFKKIYLMLGINEIGTGTAESFCKSYNEVLETLRELQPDAIIYLQAILHISESKDREHTYINNAAIIERNEALHSLADNEHIFWLDPNPAVCDENGYLIDSYTFDGVHLQAKYVYLWTDYIRQHAICTNPPSSSPDAILWDEPPQPQAMP